MLVAASVTAKCIKQILLENLTFAQLMVKKLYALWNPMLILSYNVILFYIYYLCNGYINVSYYLPSNHKTITE